MATQIRWHLHEFLARRGTRCMVYHHAQSQAEAHWSFTASGLVPCSRTPPFSFIDSERSISCEVFNFFDFSTCRLFVTIYSSFFNRPSLVASSAPSDRPMPLFTSILCGCYRIHRCRNILTSGEETLAFPELRTCTCFHQPSTTCRYRGLRSFLLANGMR